MSLTSWWLCRGGNILVRCAAAAFLAPLLPAFTRGGAVLNENHAPRHSHRLEAFIPRMRLMRENNGRFGDRPSGSFRVTISKTTWYFRSRTSATIPSGSPPPRASRISASSLSTAPVPDSSELDGVYALVE